MTIETRLESPADGLYDLFVRIDSEFDRNILQVLEALAPRLADSIRLSFDVAGERGGRDKWIEIKNPTPLIDTGVLYNSIEGAVEQHGTDYVVVIGTDVPYARVHNEGGWVMTDVVASKNPGRGPRAVSMWRHGEREERELEIPQREFLFLTSEDAMMQEDTINTGIEVMDALKNLRRI